MINSPLLKAFTIALFFLYTKALNGHDDLQKKESESELLVLIVQPLASGYESVLADK